MNEIRHKDSKFSTLDYFYYYIKGYAIAIEYKYTIIALSLAFKYYEICYSKGSSRFTYVLIDAYDLISADKSSDYTCATTILQDIIDEYNNTSDKQSLAKKYSFTNENLDALEILSSRKNYDYAISHNPLKNVTKNKLMPQNLPYNGLAAIYNFIEEYATMNHYKNTLIALKVASKLHAGQTRKGGDPYIIHPLYITLKIIYSGTDDDITCAASLLHDVIEDDETMYKCNGSLLVTEYGLDFEVLRIVRLLTKPKDYKITDPKEEKYYKGVQSDIRATNIKLHDRTDNLSTIEVFKIEKMISYVDETKERVYPLLVQKNYYPEYSQAFTNVKYVLRSNCEVIESILRRTPASIDFTGYQRTLFFIKGYAKGKNMPNTLKALSIACKLHEGQLRSIGDPFILHPLRVASYLINLKINDDTTCAAALLHEVFKKCNVTDGGIALTSKYDLSPEVFELVKLVSKPKEMSLDEYYLKLRLNPKALLIKLSNRANTCTILNTYEQEEIDEYISECISHLYPLCEYGTEHYKNFSHQINIMRSHIYQISNIVSFLTHLEK
ncbi:MAG: HD domain-containing protein [Clostridia bacterium]|nr:HD domain-containing protein [Clostridia bacterium]